MAINEYGLELPADSDEFDPSGDMRSLGDSLAPRIVVPVVNDTARDGLTASAGQLVNRLDTDNLERFDGTNWRVLEQRPDPNPFTSRYKTVNQSIPTGSYKKMKFEGIITPGIDTPDGYNFTIAEPGKYQINTSVRFAGNSSGQRVVMASVDEKQDATARRTSIVAPGGNAFGVALSVCYDLEAGNILCIYAFQSSGGSLDVESNTGYTWVDITRVVS